MVETILLVSFREKVGGRWEKRNRKGGEEGEEEEEEEREEERREEKGGGRELGGWCVLGVIWEVFEEGKLLEITAGSPARISAVEFGENVRTSSTSAVLTSRFI